MSGLRGALYALARLIGDVQAVRRGRAAERVGNRIIGRTVGRATRRWWL